MVIKSTADLADWTEYRKQTLEGLGGLQADEPVHVSQDDFEFQIHGRAWSGRIVLAGSKGNSSLAALKKEGLTFKSGTARIAKDGVTVQVKGLAKGLVKDANKTLARLSLSQVLASAEPDAEGEASQADGAARPPDAGEREKDALVERVRAAKLAIRGDLAAAQTAGAADPDIARLARLASQHEKEGRPAEALAALHQLAAVLARQKAKAGGVPTAGPAAPAPDSDPAAVDEARIEVAQRKGPLYQRAKAAIGSRPELRDAVGGFVRRADQHEKAGEFAAVVAVLDELADHLDQAEAAVDPAVAKAGAERRKADLYQRIKAAVAQQPELRGPTTALLRSADAHEKAGEFAGQLAAYDELEDLIAADPEPEDSEEAAAAVDLRQWSAYRKWLRPRLRKLSRTAAAPEPVFVSKQRCEFDIDGKTWRGHMVLAGARCRSMVQRLKGEGILFVEVPGFVREDRAIVAPGLASGAVKGGNRTLLRLRLGHLLDNAPREAAPGDDGKAVRAPTGGMTDFVRRLASLSDAIRAASTGPNSSQVTALFEQALALRDQGDFVAGLQKLEQLAPLLTANTGKEAPQTSATAGKASSAQGVKVLFTQSRLAWDLTRTRIQAELAKLAAAIRAEASRLANDPQEEEEFEPGSVDAGLAKLQGILGKLDTRLIAKLDDALTATDPGIEAARKAEAKAIVREYRAFVDADPIMAAIDTNGFVPIKVRSAALATLQALEARL